MVAAFVLHAASARAEPAMRPLRDAIRIEGDSTCLDAEALAGAVARWLKRDEIDARVAVAVAAQEQPARALSFTLSRDGQVIAVRVFDPPPAACRDLRSAAALAIALAIEAMILAPPPQQQPPPPPEAVKAPPPSPPPIRPPSSPYPAPTVAAEMLFLSGVVPGTTVGAKVGGALDVSDGLAFTASGIATLQARGSVGPGSADVQLFAGDVAACWVGARAPVDVRLCGGVAVGAVAAKGIDFGPSLTTVLPWGAAIGRLAVQRTLAPPIALVGGISGVIPWLRPDLQVTSPGGAPILYSRALPPAGVMGDVGLALSFW